MDIFPNNINVNKDNIKTDSREVTSGDVFIAIKGTVHDGHDYIKEAFKKGASSIICEKCPDNISKEEKNSIITVENTRAALGHVAKHVFGDPSGSLVVYGVTGTNGKTTTVFLIDSILSQSGRASGLVSTVFTKTENDTFRASSMTTPDQLTLNRLLSDMVASGKKAAAIEISSHALDQERVWGINLDSAVFTNISPEHLDYHGDMQTYLEDKARIFDNLKEAGTAVLNFDDVMVIGLRDSIKAPNIITFGMTKGADVHAEVVKLKAEGTELDITFGKTGRTRMVTRLIGLHNVYNILGSSAALLAGGLAIDEIKKGIENAQAVPGRLEMIASSALFMTFVDYAHTPDALENVLKCLRPMTKERLICVFGCGGDRDPAKRPVMGRIASEICDTVILTSDNPRREDPLSILDEIEKGMPNKTNYSIISERGEAICAALKEAREGDVVLIAGKGHEDYQIIGEKRNHFDDREIAREKLKELGF